MRIAYLGDPENPHVRRWAGHFAHHGCECALFCDREVWNPLEGVEIIHPRMSLARKAAAFKIVRHKYSNNLFKAGPYRHAVRRWQPDVVHGFEALEFGYAAAACRPLPVVLSPMGNDIFDWPRDSRLARFLVERALRGAAAISTNAPGLEEFLRREYGIDERKVNCFSWGVDLEVFRPGLEVEARAFGCRIGVDGDARVILSPRTMKPYWGPDLLADALGEIVRRAEGNVIAVFLRGFGDAAFEAELRERIARQGVSDHARFIESLLSAEDLAAAFNRADAFFSAPQTDLLAVTVLEGMACGCAPILADLPYYHCRVADGRNGFFLEERTAQGAANAVLRALELPRERLKEMGREAAALIAEKDDWREAAAKMERLYVNAVSSSSRPRSGG